MQFGPSVLSHQWTRGLRSKPPRKTDKEGRKKWKDGKAASRGLSNLSIGRILGLKGAMVKERISDQGCCYTWRMQLVMWLSIARRQIISFSHLREKAKLYYYRKLFIYLHNYIFGDSNFDLLDFEPCQGSQQSEE
tara:strand:- start:232 stop:636 length:405 start_codon:yes stop_codon:yes gene_type:complete